MKFRLTLAATLLLGVLPLRAHAQVQPWLADRRYGEGIGVRVGNLELHPGISGEAGYDSNYFLRSKEENPIATYRFRVTPAITLETLGQQRREGNAPSAQAPLQFSAGAYASYNELVAADSTYSSAVSKQRNLDAGANLGLNIFPVGRVGIDGYGNFVRTIQPSNDTDITNAFNRDAFRAGAGVTWRPGGGLFSWRAGYEFLYNYFEEDPFKPLNNYQNQVNLRGNWRFLPRTSLTYDGSYTWISYAKNTEQADGAIVRSQIGINGLITDQFGFLGRVGWAGTFYDQLGARKQEQFDSIVGQAEVKWYLGGQAHNADALTGPVGLSWIALGYTRDVQNSYLADFYQRDRGYAQLAYLLGGVFVGSLSGGVARLAFPGSAFSGSFAETRVDATAFGEYRLSNTVGVNLTVNYLQNITDQGIPRSQDVTPATCNGDASRCDFLAFQDWQAFLGVRWFL